MSRRILICSGAGLSAESGIPTFRDSGGLWENYKVEEVCNIRRFMEFYIKTNEFYDARRAQLENVEPNSAHIAIADLCNNPPTNYEIINITTNVDDLLERAGCKDVIHLHGSLVEVIRNWGTGDEQVEYVGYQKSDYDDMSVYPTKPNVVFFGEHAPEYKRFYEILMSLEMGDIAMVIGSSDQVVEFVDLIKSHIPYGLPLAIVNTVPTNRPGTSSFVMPATEFCRDHMKRWLQMGGVVFKTGDDQ